MAAFRSRTVAPTPSTGAQRSGRPSSRRPKQAALDRSIRSWTWRWALALRRLGRWWKWGIIGAGTAGFGFLAITWMMLPDIGQSLRAAQSTVITDRNGIELYRLFVDEDRTYVDSDEIPQHMKDAIVAIEDERFYDHGCIDARAIARAVFVNVLNVSYSQGFSTLTQQLARNALLGSREKSIVRKLRELMLACKMESRYDKDTLLELYLNWIPFGQNAYGIEQASKRYFGISAKDLTLAQSAVLASLPQRPSYFNPYGQYVRTGIDDVTVRMQIANGKITRTADIPDDAVTIGLMGRTFGTGSNLLYIGGRTDQVLENMRQQGYITDEEKASATKALETLEFKQARDSIRAPHFVLWVRQQAEDILQGSTESDVIAQGGLRIETSLDWSVQQLAEAAVEYRRAETLDVYGARNIALMAVDPATRDVIAYVGNADYHNDEISGKIDMARSPRQPGSSFKPIVYASAFKQGYSPGSIVADSKIRIGSYEPQNFDGKFLGVMTARSALAASRNIPAIKAYYLAGEEDAVLDVAAGLGAETPRERKPEAGYGPALAIGAAETPLVEMTSAYATLADGGVHKPLVTIKRITDQGGAILYEASQDAFSEQVLDPRIAYMVTSILSDGSARPDDFWRNALSVPGTAAAAKTGTSNKCLKTDANGNCTERKPLDVWTMGYTPTLVAGVWIGNADASALAPTADGLNVAAPIWKDFLTRVTASNPAPVTQFSQPEGLIQVQISTLSGELPTTCTPLTARKADLFLREKPPTLQDPACKKLAVDRVTGLLPSDVCPAEAVEEREFFSPYEPTGRRFPHWLSSIEYPDLPKAPTEKCDPALTPGREVKPTVSIVSPIEGGIATFPIFHPRYNAKTGNGLSEVSWFIDDTIVNRETSAPFDSNIRLPKSFNPEGTHTLRVEIRDTYFNLASDEVQFTFGEDRTPPVVTIQTEGPLTVKAGATFSVRATADDAESGVKTVEFSLANGTATTRSRAPYEAQLTAPAQPGNYVLRVQAENYAERLGSATLQLIVLP